MQFGKSKTIWMKIYLAVNVSAVYAGEESLLIWMLIAHVIEQCFHTRVQCITAQTSPHKQVTVRSVLHGYTRHTITRLRYQRILLIISQPVVQIWITLKIVIYNRNRETKIHHNTLHIYNDRIFDIYCMHVLKKLYLPSIGGYNRLRDNRTSAKDM